MTLPMCAEQVHQAVGLSGTQSKLGQPWRPRWPRPETGKTMVYPRLDAGFGVTKLLLAHRNRRYKVASLHWQSLLLTPLVKKVQLLVGLGAFLHWWTIQRPSSRKLLSVSLRGLFSCWKVQGVAPPVSKIYRKLFNPSHMTQVSVCVALPMPTFLLAQLLNRRLDRLRVLACVSCLFILLTLIGILIFSVSTTNIGW